MDSDRIEREEMLRRAVLAGDELAWRALYGAAFNDLDRYVRWRCGGRGDWTDEIVQETWLVAVRRIRRFDPRQGSFLAWLRGIAANLVRNELRRRRRSPKVEAADSELVTADMSKPSANGRHRQEAIARALDALSEREEVVLRAKYLEGKSVAEIARDSGDTPKAVESLLSRARQAFREVYRHDD
jgi:RNA polymerase sigma-70 factor, ECF subfamily